MSIAWRNWLAMSCAKKSWALPARFWWQISMQNGFALFVAKQYIVLKLQADLPQEDVGERKMAVRILG